MDFEHLWEICKGYLINGREIDVVHTRISTDFAWRLIREESKGDEKIIIPAIMLHDIGYSQIPDKEVYKKTTFMDVSNKVYDVVMKDRHLIEGEKLAKQILTNLDFPRESIRVISEIVRTHEDLYGGKPEGGDFNKIIVSDADKLCRFTAYNMTSVTLLHGVDEKSAFEYIRGKLETWLILENSKEIAREELRKLPISFAKWNQSLI